MPLTVAQLDALHASVDSLVADPAVDPLQALLDAANATIADLHGQIASANSALVDAEARAVALQLKITNAQAALA